MTPPDPTPDADPAPVQPPAGPPGPFAAPAAELLRPWRLHGSARELSPLPPGTAIALGACDGLHLGHQALLARARELGEQVALATFDPHPARVLAPDRAPPLLLHADGRERALARLGVAGLATVEFDAALAATPPAEFVSTVLVRGLQPSGVVVGEDFRFGRGREGDAEGLARQLAAHEIPVLIVAEVPAPAGVDVPESWRGRSGKQVSSTAVRGAIAGGAMDVAGALLGRWHAVHGTVVTGAQRGRTIGFPTANVAVDGGVLPPAGVYVTVLAVLDAPDPALVGAMWPAVANLGKSPTFHADADAPPDKLEVHALDQALGERLYGAHVEVGFLARLRPEQRFAGAAELVAQIARDCAAARGLHGELGEARGLGGALPAHVAARRPWPG